MKKYFAAVQMVLIALTALPPRCPAETGQSPKDQKTWTDPKTGLVWTTSDNGAGVSWKQAQRYCEDLRTGGVQGWTLPSIDELQTLFGGPENDNGRHVRGPIKLTGWEWSSTPGQQDGEGWTLDFGDGARASVAAGDSGLNRALCVRH